MSGFAAINGEPDGRSAAAAHRPHRRGHRAGGRVRHDGRGAQRAWARSSTSTCSSRSSSSWARCPRRSRCSATSSPGWDRASPTPSPAAPTARRTTGGWRSARRPSRWPAGCSSSSGVGDDERFHSFAGRVAHREELDAAMAAWVGARELDVVLAEFDAAHAAAAPVMTMADIASDPHIAARRSIVEVDGTPMQGLIARLSATPGRDPLGRSSHGRRHRRGPGRARRARTARGVRGLNPVG